MLFNFQLAWGACMAGGHVWWDVCMAGGACMADTTSMSGRYVSYWNAFLFKSRKVRHTSPTSPQKNLSTLRIFLPSFHYDNSHYTLFVSFQWRIYMVTFGRVVPLGRIFFIFIQFFGEIWANNRLTSTLCRNSGSATVFWDEFIFGSASLEQNATGAPVLPDVNRHDQDKTLRPLPSCMRVRVCFDLQGMHIIHGLYLH